MEMKTTNCHDGLKAAILSRNCELEKPMWSRQDFTNQVQELGI